MLQSLLNFFSNKKLNRLHLFILTSLIFNPTLLRLTTSGCEFTCVQSKNIFNCNHSSKFLALLYFYLALEKTILRHEPLQLQPFSLLAPFIIYTTRTKPVICILHIYLFWSIAYQNE